MAVDEAYRRKVLTESVAETATRQDRARAIVSRLRPIPAVPLHPVPSRAPSRDRLPARRRSPASFVVSAQMSLLHVEKASLRRMPAMRAARPVAQPTARPVPAILVLQHALDDEHLLAVRAEIPAPVATRRHPGQPGVSLAGRRVAVERQQFRTLHRAGTPDGRRGVDCQPRPVRTRILPQLDEQGAARPGPRGVARAVRVEKMAAGRIVAGFVGEHAVENQDLLAVGMGVARKARAGIEPHHRGHPPRLDRAGQFQPLAPHPGDRARLPIQFRGSPDDAAQDAGGFGHDVIPEPAGPPTFPAPIRSVNRHRNRRRVNTLGALGETSAPSRSA